MTRTTLRARLLGGVVLGVGISALAPTAASAQCAVSPTGTPVVGSISCATTTTTDTTYDGLSASATDRNYNVDTSGGDVTATVTGDVTGYGLALTNTVGGDNTLFIVNDGSVEVTAGFPFAGGNAGLQVNAIGDTNVDYAGTGNVINPFADGLEIAKSGSGFVNVDMEGNVEADSYGILVQRNGSGPSGDTTVVTAAGTTIDAGYLGVAIYENQSDNTGTLTLTNNADIGSFGGNQIDWGVSILSQGLGGATITNNGQIGSDVDRLRAMGIESTFYNAANTQTFTILGTGDIYSTGYGIGHNNESLGEILIAYSGDIDSQSNGINVNQSNADSEADVVVAYGGAMTSTGYGINVLTAGSGATLVDNTAGSINSTGSGGINVDAQDGFVVVRSGTITTAGGNGVSTQTTSGQITINVNGAIDANAGGVSAQSTSGLITVNVNDSITSGANGVTLSSSGDKYVLVSLAGSIDSTGLNDITFNNGGLGTVTNYGLIGGTADGVAVTSATTQVTVDNMAGGVINGGVSFGTADDVINNAGVWNVGDMTAMLFNTGADELNNLAGGVLNLGVGALIDGLETLSNAGTINQDGALSINVASTVDLTFTNTGVWNTVGVTTFGGVDDVLVNAAGGTINLTGDAEFAGLETFTQNGRLNLDTFTLTGPAIAFVNGGTIDTNGSAGLAGFTSMTNNGTIDLGPGTFTAPAGVFTNNGTVIADEGATTITGQSAFTMGAAGVIDLQDGAPNDVLTIVGPYNGNGTLQVDVSQTAADRLVLTGAISGQTAVDINVVGVTNLGLNQLVVDASSASLGAFVTGDVTGTLNPLVDYGIVQSGNDYFVAAAPNAAAFDPLAVTTLARDFWYQSADEVIAQTRLPFVATGFGVWGQIYGSIDKTGENDTQVINGVEFNADNKLETTRYGIQAGVDFGLGGGRLGLTGGWAKAEADGNAEYSIAGWNLGVYGQFGGELGMHGEALVKYDKFDVDFEDGLFDGLETDGHSWGIDGALGYRFQAGLVPILDLNVGLSHVRTKIDDVSAYGFGYDYGTMTSTRARGGARAYFGGGWRPYIDATVYHEFDGDGEIGLFDGASVYDLRSSGKGTWVRLEGGLGGQPNRGPMLAVWGEAGDRKGAGIRLGFRFGGAAQEVLPPPPPMVEPVAPPPPPATQTCADGTVILATEACPPPPPPPPPVAEPERG